MEVKGNYSPVQVVNFFLFNTTWGPKEGEEEKKIVYFWPQDLSVEAKLKKVGLVEGVVNFACRFSNSSPAHSLHTLKERLVFQEVEKDYWVCVVVSVPNTRKQQSKGESGEVIEFYPEEVSDEVLLSMLSRAYQMFCLFNSGLGAALAGRCAGNIKVFLELVQHFFSRYLGTLRVDKGDMTYIWGGIQYLAIDMIDFLRVQSVINRIKSDHQTISKCLFLHSGQLVWSDVEPNLTKLLVQYLSTTILASLNSLPRKPTGSFLVGEEGKLPTVFLCDTSYHLAVYHVVNTTLVLLLTSPPPQNFFTRFKASPGQELGNLSADLTHTYISKGSSTTCSSSTLATSSSSSNLSSAVGTGPAMTSSSGSGSASPDNVMFLYFNASNLAVKSTVSQGHSKAIMLAQDFLQDLKTAAGPDGLLGGEGEIVSRLSSDEWVVLQVAGARTIVVLLTEKNINLMDVAESVNRLKKTSFDNICML
eukprot:TRINITY_DN2220_c0_g1_i1.p1 TRINITY_DN2220_c0_g1~~TRINITY_DN2220_c0_g1_i1.p1  ORF type:complete len:475 (-),score=112.44 TRINITY_DN2220_c0_g1_i1:487-1911(-)